MASAHPIDDDTLAPTDATTSGGSKYTHTAKKATATASISGDDSTSSPAAWAEESRDRLPALPRRRLPSRGLPRLGFKLPRLADGRNAGGSASVCLERLGASLPRVRSEKDTALAGAGAVAAGGELLAEGDPPCRVRPLVPPWAPPLPLLPPPLPLSWVWASRLNELTRRY